MNPRELSQSYLDLLEEIRLLAAEEEREACALICGSMADFAANNVVSDLTCQAVKVAVLQDATDRIRARRSSRIPTLLPGWICDNPRCGVFNGEAKVIMAHCRACGVKRPK